MKVRYTISVGGLSGKNSGGVHNQNGTARKLARPSNPRTNSQMGVRASFTTNSKAWAALTDAQRLSFVQLGSNLKATDRIGNKHVLKGKQTYSRINNNLLGVGVAALSSAPADQTVVAPATASFASNTSAAQTVAFTATPVPANTKYIIRMTKPLSAGYSVPPKGAFRTVQVVAAAGTSPANTFAAYGTIFGTPVTGKKIFGTIQAINTVNGAKSTPLSFSSTTA